MPGNQAPVQRCGVRKSGSLVNVLQQCGLGEEDKFNWSLPEEDGRELRVSVREWPS